MAENEPHPTDANRNSDGTWAEGNTLGCVSIKGRTTWRKRIEQLDETFDTGEKLLEMFEKDEKGQLRLDVHGDPIPSKELLKRHHRDIALLMQAACAFIGREKRQERETFLDRDEGKSRQSIAIAGDPNNPTPIQMNGTFTLNFAPEDDNGGDEPSNSAAPTNADVEKT